MFAIPIVTIAIAITIVVPASSESLENVALNKPSYQTDVAHGGVPSRAVDGNADPNWGGASCTHTNSLVHPWWSVDLGQIYAIDHVTVYGRMDCCRERLSDVSMLIGTTNDNYVEQGYLAGQLSPSHTFELTSPVNGRWVKILRSSDVNDYFTVCEVQVFADPLPTMANVALNKPAFQIDLWGDGVASRAVDGNTDTNWGGASCTHTNSLVHPWWSVDLGQIYAIDHVTVYGRMDCCRDRLSDVSMLIGTTNDNYVEQGYLAGQLSPSHTFKLTSPVNGRWVKIQRSSDVQDYFTVCEVQVYADPIPSMPNVALNKPAFQIDLWGDGIASRAVDGNTDTNWGGASCTHTNSLVHPWWSVDLGQIYAIDHVTVYGRTDCCSERLSDVSLLIGTTDDNYVEQGYLEGQLAPSHTFELPSSVYGRWVKIQRSSDVQDYFTVCEVQVFGNPLDEDNSEEFEEESKTLTNLALNKPTFQTRVDYGGVPSRAVDGNTNTNWFDAYSCTCAANVPGAFWAVDLGQVSAIDHVTIYGRTDCCEDRLRSVRLLISTNGDDYIEQGYYDGSISPSYTFKMQSTVNGRLVKITRSEEIVEYLTLCEVEVYGYPIETTMTNLALNKPTFQTKVDYGGVPSRAVDGNINTNWFDAFSCTCTANEPGAFWAVDLGQVYTIDHVTVYGRTDCCEDRLRSVRLLISTDGEEYVEQGYYEGTISPFYTFEMQSPVNGRFVQITRTEEVLEYLTLCEVEVYGYPPIDDNNSEEIEEENPCKGIFCDECPFGYVQTEEDTCCGQCQICPPLPCKTKFQYQDEGMSCPECMCKYKGDYVKAGPVGDTCEECECANGEISCTTVECPKVKCVDPVMGECCLECPNGETCRHKKDLIVKGETLVTKKQVCMCAPFWYPTALCTKRKVKNSVFTKGTKMESVAKWSVPNEE